MDSVFPLGVDTINRNSLLGTLFTTNNQTILHDFQNFRLMHRPFGKTKRRVIFILIFFINMVTNFDHGAIPAATTTLKNNLNIDNFQLGIIGSLVYLGLVFGALSAGFIFQNYSPKWIITIALIMSSMFLYFFTITESIFWMGFSRVGCGFFQVFCLIYFPVWVDEYGVKNLRTYWLSFLQLGVPLGTMLGYLIEAININSDDIIHSSEENIKENHSWKNAFYIQIILLLTQVVLLILTPDKFFSKNYKRSNIDEEKFQEEYYKFSSKADNTNQGSPKVGPQRRKDKKKSFKSLRKERELTKYTRLSQYSIFSIVDQNDENDGMTYTEIITDLINNKVYLFTLLGICCLLFIITGIQFWISDYMLTILHIKPETVFISFTIVCISAPVLGVIYGGYIIQSVGGYTNTEAINICLKYGIVAACCGIFTPYIDVFFFFIVFIWLLLFFGASIVPGLTGIMLSSLGDYSKEVANSITHLCYNLLGYLPSPFMYGLVCSYTGGQKSRWGLQFLMFFSILGVVFLYLAKNQKEKNEENGKVSQNESFNSIDELPIKLNK